MCHPPTTRRRRSSRVITSPEPTRERGEQTKRLVGQQDPMPAVPRELARAEIQREISEPYECWSGRRRRHRLGPFDAPDSTLKPAERPPSSAFHPPVTSRSLRCRPPLALDRVDATDIARARTPIRRTSLTLQLASWRRPMRQVVFVIALLSAVSCGGDGGSADAPGGESPISPTPLRPALTLSGTVERDVPDRVDSHRGCDSHRCCGSGRRRPLHHKRRKRRFPACRATARKLHDSRPGSELRREHTAPHARRKPDARGPSRSGVSDGDDDQRGLHHRLWLVRGTLGLWRLMPRAVRGSTRTTTAR